MNKEKRPSENQEIFEEAQKIIQQVKNLSSKYNLDVHELLENETQRVIEKNLEMLDGLKDAELAMTLDNLLRSGEKSFDLLDVSLIKNMARKKK